MRNKEIYRYLLVLEEQACSSRWFFVQKDIQKAHRSAENDRNDR